jgi:Ala-tRNA(Pro) deacylase
MLHTETDLLHFLDAQGIGYQRVEHPPVYTCEQAELFRPVLPGVSTKNLFLRDEKRRYFLAMTACEKRLDLKQLGRQAGAPKLNLASAEKLMELLGVTPGAVTVLGLVNDVEHTVTLWVDEEIWQGEFFWCHPLVNTATLVLVRRDLVRFFALTGHPPVVLKMPARSA